MNLLVTGAAGFIGSTVAAALLRRGDTVLGIDNLNAYYGVREPHRLPRHPRRLQAPEARAPGVRLLQSSRAK